MVVYLDVSPNQLYERTRRDKNRPLLQVENPLQRLLALHGERAPLYREIADVVIDGNRTNAQSVVQTILKEYENRCNH